MSEPLDKLLGDAKVAGNEPPTNPKRTSHGRLGNLPPSEEQPPATSQATATTSQNLPPATVEAEVGKEGEVQIPQAPSPSPSKAEDKEEKPEGKPGRLNDEEKQTVYGLLHQGQSQRFILGIFGAGKNDSIAKMADELEKEEAVFYEGRWVKAEEQLKHDTSKAGESAAKAAATAVISATTTATAETAVELQAQILELGTYVKEEYEGVSRNNGYTIPQFLEVTFEFWALNKGVVPILKSRNKAMADYIDFLEMELGRAAEQIKEQQEATRMFIDMVGKTKG